MRGVLGIAYFLWAERRLMLLPLFALVVAPLLAMPFLVGSELFEMMPVCSAMVLGLCLLVIGIPLELRPPFQDVAFPSRLFILPVKTRTLVLWPMLLASVSLIPFWMSIAAALFLQYGVVAPVLVPCLASAVLINVLLAMVWAPITNPFIKWLILFPGMVVAVALLVAVAEQIQVGKSALPEGAIAIVLGLCLVLAYFVAVASVDCDRRGDTWLSGIARRRTRGRRTAARRLSPFRSPESAQLWFNLRTIAVAASIGSALLLFFSSLSLLFAYHAPKILAEFMDWPRLFGSLVLASLPLGISALQGISLGGTPALRRARPSILGAGNARIDHFSFSFLLPISSARLAVSLFRACLIAVSVGWLVFLLMAAVRVEIWIFVLRGYPGWQGPGFLALTAVVLAGLTWRFATDQLVAEFGDGPRAWIGYLVPLSLWTLDSLVLLTIWLLLDPSGLAPFAGFLRPVVGVVLCVKVIVAAVAYRIAWRRGLIELRPLCQFAIVSVVFASAAMAWLFVLLPEHGLPVSRGILLLGVLALVPLGRFALVPICLDRRRHA